MTDYGQMVLEKLIPPLVKAGVTIVSGFMYGVDATAHQLCLEAGGRTIAVLGCGLNHTVPEGQEKLRETISQKGGLIISELPPDHRPFPWTFVRRNRIIAGLSQAVLVIEASEKSGALITAQRAWELKRPVLAVPGPITQKSSAGCNWLIQQGAKLVQKPADVLTVLKLPDYASKQKSRSGQINNQLTGIAKKIVQILEERPQTGDEIAREIGAPISQVMVELTRLNLKGVIKEMGGRWRLVNS